MTTVLHERTLEDHFVLKMVDLGAQKYGLELYYTQPSPWVVYQAPLDISGQQPQTPEDIEAIFGYVVSTFSPETLDGLLQTAWSLILSASELKDGPSD